MRPASRVAVRCASLKYAGHGDDGAIDFVVDLALLGEERLGAALQLAQDERRDLGRRELAVAEADPARRRRLRRSTRNGSRLASSLDVVEALAHEALDGIDRARRVGQQAPLRFAADVDRPVRRRRHDRRQQRVAAAVADDDGHAVLHVGDQAVGRAEIDADDAGSLSSVSRSMPASRLLM